MAWMIYTLHPSEKLDTEKLTNELENNGLLVQWSP